MIKNVISVIDGAAGSCGKAKVVGEIATNKSIILGASVTNCMPNAGHTFVDENGNSIVFRNIPVSSVNPYTELFIGPGSAIDMKIFSDEYNRVNAFLGDRKIYVHEMVPLIEERHKLYEIENIKSGSTFKGCGAVSQEKIIRNNKLNFFKTFKNAVVCKNEEWLERLYKHLDNPNEYVMLEGAQGCDLSLNYSGNYPYVTSRNVSTAQLLSDSGVSVERLLQTIMVIRPFPIRISNITKLGDIIYTGKYGEGIELTWSQINLSSIHNTYPYVGDYEDYCNSINTSYLKKLVCHCSEVYLKQLFGNDYRKKDINFISINEALELERLVYKSKNILKYESKINNNIINDQSEQTTVTKMERRIFDLDINKLKTNCLINTPSSLYLNFFQHLSLDYKECKGNFDDYYFNRYIREYLNWIESNSNVDISALGTSSRNGDRILRKNIVNDIVK